MTAQPLLEFRPVALNPSPDVVWSASRPRSLSSSSTSRSESEYRRYQRTVQTISSGAVCRHLKIAGRVAFLTLFSGYQPPLAIVATHPFLRSTSEEKAIIEAKTRTLFCSATKLFL